MDTARYVIALLLVVTMPPAFLFWFMVHPFVGFWRRLGVFWSYTLLFGSMGLMCWGLYLLRQPLLGRDLGTSWPLVVLAVVLYSVTIALYIQRRRQLTNRILMGLPEIAPEQHPPKLLTEGLYAHIRHPRYVEVAFAVLAFACFANYSGGYLVFLGTLVLLWITVELEERELRERFGAEYEEYRRRVPRFIPRRRSTSNS